MKCDVNITYNDLKCDVNL